MLMHQSRLAPSRVSERLSPSSRPRCSPTSRLPRDTPVAPWSTYTDLDLRGRGYPLYARLRYASQKVCNSYDSARAAHEAPPCGLLRQGAYRQSPR